jgi:hypothetical protein
VGIKQTYFNATSAPHGRALPSLILACLVPPMTAALPKPAPGPRRGSPSHRRRTATAVLAGEFDEKPPRDVLTSVLNGVPVYEVVENQQEELKRARVPGKERDAQRGQGGHGVTRIDWKNTMTAPAFTNLASSLPSATASVTALSLPSRQSSGTPRPLTASGRVANGRPAIHMVTAQRARSLTPPPPIMPSSPVTTPEPSITSSQSRASSKRPRTPNDDEELPAQPGPSASPIARPPRKKRVPVRKGWKGWVEGSPPPSDKLINLDQVQILPTRRTRSGRNFDA